MKTPDFNPAFSNANFDLTSQINGDSLKDTISRLESTFKKGLIEDTFEPCANNKCSETPEVDENEDSKDPKELLKLLLQAIVKNPELLKNDKVLQVLMSILEMIKGEQNDNNSQRPPEDILPDEQPGVNQPTSPPQLNQSCHNPSSENFVSTNNKPSFNPMETFRNFINDPVNTVTNLVGSGKEVLKNINDIFVSQNRGPFNPNEDAPNNGNCVFASTLMMLKMFGKADGSPADHDSMIENLRTMMGASPDEYTGHSVQQTASFFRGMGLNAENYSGRSFQDVVDGLNEGKKFMLAVDPKHMYSNVDHSTHAVVLAGINQETGNAIILDPGSNGVSEVPIDKLQRAMQAAGNRMVAVSNPNNQLTSARKDTVPARELANV